MKRIHTYFLVFTPATFIIFFSAVIQSIPLALIGFLLLFLSFDILTKEEKVNVPK